MRSSGATNDRWGKLADMRSADCLQSSRHHMLFATFGAHTRPESQSTAHLLAAQAANQLRSAIQLRRAQRHFIFKLRLLGY